MTDNVDEPTGKKWKPRERPAPEPRKVEEEPGYLPTFDFPHKYTPYARGIPTINVKDPSKRMPSVNMPPEMQHSIGCHLEYAGFIHVSELKELADADGNINVSKLPKQWYVHVKPKHGPDISINPGTWEAADIVENEQRSAAFRKPVEPVIAPADVKGASPEELAATMRVIQAEQIRQLKINNADPAAKAAALAEEEQK